MCCLASHKGYQAWCYGFMAVWNISCNILAQTSPLLFLLLLFYGWWLLFTVTVVVVDVVLVVFSTSVSTAIYCPFTTQFSRFFFLSQRFSANSLRDATIIHLEYMYLGDKSQVISKHLYQRIQLEVLLKYNSHMSLVHKNGLHADWSCSLPGLVHRARR